VQTANVRLGQSVFSDASSHAERGVHPQTQNSTESCAPPKSGQQQRRSGLMTCLLLGRRALASPLSQASENSFSDFLNLAVKLIPLFRGSTVVFVPSPWYYRHVCPRYRGNTVTSVPIAATSAVKCEALSPLPRDYRDITAVPITMQLSILHPFQYETIVLISFCLPKPQSGDVEQSYSL